MDNLEKNTAGPSDNMPLPDMEQSWQQMQKLLDDDDDKRRPVIPVFLKSCAGWGLALLAIGFGAWYLYQHADQKKNTVSGTSTNTVQSNKKIDDPHQNTTPDKNQNSSTLPGTVPTGKTITSGQGNENQCVNVPDPVTGNASAQPSGNNAGQLQTKNMTLDNQAYKRKNEKQASKIDKPRLEKMVPVTIPSVNPGKENTQPAATADDQQAARLSKNRPDDQLQTAPVSITTENAGIAQPADTATSNTPPADSTAASSRKTVRTKRYLLSGGAGVQQQVPFGNQKAVPYDYYGRKGSVYDYIPSVYLRFEKKNKWFFQAEFRYGAPQSLTEFSYNRKTKLDSTQTQLVTTTYRLKKTYYHQLPVSFNYYVRPGWSVGLGGIYSRFSGAVTEQEIRNKNLQTQQETVSKKILNIRSFTDSFLYKTQVHLLLQTEYQWKRFTFGIRYTKDVQPFIKYTEPDGRVDVKKNQTIQLLARFRIFQKAL